MHPTGSVAGGSGCFWSEHTAAFKTANGAAALAALNAQLLAETVPAYQLNIKTAIGSL